ncbi:MAG: elongation factor 1-beta [Thaumarchaeota archaeon]|nr:elongation factor 1-beta [Nitrososphaerota archaeon]MCL5319134.1 elongation factor 1-beta [Nitrososphaerota archaeon]
MKVFPTDAEIKSSDLVESVKSKLPAGMVIKRTSEEPVAFGLVATVMDVQMEEKDGSMDALEEAVRSSDLVSQLDVLGVSRVSASLK